MGWFRTKCPNCHISNSNGIFNWCVGCKRVEEERLKFQVEKIQMRQKIQAAQNNSLPATEAQAQRMMQEMARLQQNNSLAAQNTAVSVYQNGIVTVGPATPNGWWGSTDTHAPLPSAGMKVEDLIGWRIWRLRNGYLMAFSQDHIWMPGEVEEGTPGDYDHVGIWAFKTPRRAVAKLVETSGASYVWGSVRLWGSVVEHADGYRASKARIVSLEGATDTVTDETFSRLCRRYGVPESKEQST